MSEEIIDVESVEVPVGDNRVQVLVDDKNSLNCYSNFCRVTGTPEELIMDFGLNPQPLGIPTEPIKIYQKVIMNFYTAKRMFHALGMTLQRHENTFGELEVDVQKRIKVPVTE
jgi:hypothetical protein